MQRNERKRRSITIIDDVIGQDKCGQRTVIVDNLHALALVTEYLALLPPHGIAPSVAENQQGSRLAQKLLLGTSHQIEIASFCDEAIPAIAN